MAKDAILLNLMDLFRAFGYDGVSISQISQVTGLGKSSLYHHFPGGKEQMATEVLELVDSAVKEHFISPLKGSGLPKVRLATMLAAVRAYYENGKKSCIADGLTLGDANSLFKQAIANCLTEWATALKNLYVEAGFTQAEARERAEEALIGIEGALIVSRAMSDSKPFERTLRKIQSSIER